MASVCWYTRLTIPVSGGGAPYYSWPSNTTCTPSEGLCYTSATVVGGELHLRRAAGLLAAILIITCTRCCRRLRRLSLPLSVSSSSLDKDRPVDLQYITVHPDASKKTTATAFCLRGHRALSVDSGDRLWMVNSLLACTVEDCRTWYFYKRGLESNC